MSSIMHHAPPQQVPVVVSPPPSAPQELRDFFGSMQQVQSQQTILSQAMVPYGQVHVHEQTTALVPFTTSSSTAQTTTAPTIPGPYNPFRNYVYGQSTSAVNTQAALGQDSLDIFSTPQQTTAVSTGLFPIGNVTVPTASSTFSAPSTVTLQPRIMDFAGSSAGTSSVVSGPTSTTFSSSNPFVSASTTALVHQSHVTSFSASNQFDPVLNPFASAGVQSMQNISTSNPFMKSSTMPAQQNISSNNPFPLSALVPFGQPSTQGGSMNPAGMAESNPFMRSHSVGPGGQRHSWVGGMTATPSATNPMSTFSTMNVVPEGSHASAIWAGLDPLHPDNQRR